MVKIKVEYCDVVIDSAFVSKFGATKRQLNDAITILGNAFYGNDCNSVDRFAPREIVLGRAIVNVVGADEYDRCCGRLKAIISYDM
ncbi:hypothetical protein FAM4067_01696 [Lacticaseibacillus paracasei]|uniref:hypothetical protein n=1 Tax=Lacticaseibacillus paracasei TaxID=1597 RepID=UPI000FF74DC9|nr:hypothetical protein [Lacticaseibacillus paracasei]RNE20036.1 hypothetical protein FAM4067_01696 [Lacticaseibacillus paracasei]